MAGRSLAAALALTLALGDVSWAARAAAAPARARPAAAIPALRAAPRVVLGGLTPVVPMTARMPSAAVSAAAARAEQDQRWDAAAPARAMPEPVAAAAAAAAPPALAPAAASVPALPTPAIPAPSPLKVGAMQVASWAGLIGLSALTHAPFDRMGPLVITIVMGLGLGLPLSIFAKAFQDEPGWGGDGSVGPRPVSDAESRELDARLQGFAAEGGLGSLPLSVIPDARVGAEASTLEARVHGGVLDIPLEQQDAILRHEISHARHADGVWTAADLFLVSVPPLLAAMGGIYGDWRAWLAVPALAASLYLVGEGSRRREFLADHYSAHRQGTSAPLVEVLRRFERDDAADAARPSTGRLDAMARAAGRVWSVPRRLWRSHPSHRARIERLEALERASTAPPEKR